MTIKQWFLSLSTRDTGYYITSNLFPDTKIVTDNSDEEHEINNLTDQTFEASGTGVIADIVKPKNKT